MYNTSQRWKEKIYTKTQCVMNVYIDDVLVNPTYITDFKIGQELFNGELKLGSISSQYIDMKIHKKSSIKNPKNMKIEYGIQVYNNNNTSTVNEINKILLGDLNGIKIKSLASQNQNFEIIPIGIFNVENFEEEEDNIISISALDNMIKFEFNFDGSKLKYPITLVDLLKEICLKAGVELRFYFFY